MPPLVPVRAGLPPVDGQLEQPTASEYDRVQPVDKIGDLGERRLALGDVVAQEPTRGAVIELGPLVADHVEDADLGGEVTR